MSKHALRVIRLISLMVLMTACISTSPSTAVPPVTSPTPPPTVVPTHTPITSGVIDPQVSNCNVTPPTSTIASAILSRDLPCTMTFAPPATLDNLQRDFDFYSWLTFIALNSPADSGAVIGADAATVWEQWKEIYEVMLPDSGQI